MEKLGGRAGYRKFVVDPASLLIERDDPFRHEADQSYYFCAADRIRI